MANEASDRVGVLLMLNQSRLTPKSGDRLTRRQRKLLSEIASMDEKLGYELSYLIEPNWWMDLYLSDQWDGKLDQCIVDGSFPWEMEDPMYICWDEWEQNRGKLSETPEEEWKRLELEAIHREIRDSNCD